MTTRSSWVCHIFADTHAWDGTRRRMSRLVECGGDVEAGMLRALQARRDKGVPFQGCEIHAITPLGQVVSRVLDPDTGKLVKEGRE